MARRRGRHPGLPRVVPGCTSCSQQPDAGLRRNGAARRTWLNGWLPGSGSQRSDRLDLLGLRALGPLGRGELDPLVLLEAAVAGRLDSGVVHEDVGGAIVWGDETEALVRVEPLHCALSHLILLLLDDRRKPRM